MLILITVIFAVAALGGLTLLTYILRNKNTPKGLAIMHGLIAALGILLLLIYVILHPSHLYISLIIFILAALGGALLMFRDVTNKSVPKWFALGHGLIAVAAFLILLVFLLS